MNTSNGPVRPTPRNLYPVGTVCFQIDLPDDGEWIGAFIDNFIQLTYWMAWQRDTDHTGRIIAARWLDAFNTIRLCKQEQPVSGCPDPGDDYLIRQNPDNPCLIETSADGTHWCTLIDLSTCIAPSDQPGSGARQPLPGGGSACYQGKLNAAHTLLVPTVVNTGDVVEFSDINGAGTDGTGHWYCPDGQIFFAGACVGSLSFDSGDPAPSIHHMALIAKIGSHYYDITAGPITVPSSITNEQVTVQVNDGTLTDNSGDYNLKACVTNNTALTFEHTWDFTLSPGGWFLTSYGSPGFAGSWIPGVGWRHTDNVYGGDNVRGVNIERAVSSTQHITYAEVHFSFTQGTYDILPQLAQVFYPGLTAILSRTTPSLVTGAGQVIIGTGSIAIDTPMQLYFFSDSTAGAPSGAVTITKLIVRGEGADPF